MKPPRWIRAATLRSLVVFLLVLIAAGCSEQPATQPTVQSQSQPSDFPTDAPETASDGKLAITVSILPQQYFVERVGGEHVAVNVMVPPGEFPGTYEPEPDQLAALSEADAYISIDVPFERAWLERFQQANPDMLMVDTTQSIERRGPSDQPDPHIWLSPLLVKKQARTIADALIELDPTHTEEYEANLRAFTSDIDTLYEETTATLETLETRKFIVFHPAWGYFAQDYNLEMIPIEVGGQEPSATELAEVVEQAREDHIKVIFAQPQFNPKSAHTLADEIGGEVVLIDPLAPDWLANQYRVANTFARVLGYADDEHDHEEDEHDHEEDEHDHEEEADHAAESIDLSAITPIAEGETLSVVATTSIVGDVVSNVGGSAINLTVLMPPGTDPHTFEPTPRDLAVVSDADIVFANGVGLEVFMESMLESTGANEGKVIHVSHGIELIEFGASHDHDHEHDEEAEHEHDEEAEHEHDEEAEHEHDEEAEHEHDEEAEHEHDEEAEHEHDEEAEHEHDHSGLDPHVWFSPVSVEGWVDNIEHTLHHADPTNSDIYRDNAAAYRGELHDLDAWIKEQVAHVPEANRKLVTDHTAFGYFAHRYGFEQVGAVVPAYSTMAEPSAQELAELEDAIREHGVPAIFVGTTVNPSLSERVAQDTGVELVTLYTGSLSEAGGEADTYLKLMRYDVQAIVGALSNE